MASLVSPAAASPCQDDIAKIDAALASSEKITPEQRLELDDLRNQAVQLCGAGNDQEGLDVTAQAKAILDLQ